MKWNVDPEIFRLGPLAIRYYSLMFVIGFITMEKYVKKLFAKNGKDPELVSTLTIYIIAGTFIGARLAHCFFYDPGYYLSNPLSILKVWEGGLASHGGYTGVIIAVALFLKKHKGISFLWLMDCIAGPCLFVGGLIRVGNFFNSEIIGKPTSLPWGIVFERVDPLTRHPAQLYESLGYFTISFILAYMFSLKTKGASKSKLVDGTVMASAFVIAFAFRFFIEFVKDNQSTISRNLPINMGQILSLFFVAFGVALLAKFLSKKKEGSDKVKTA